MAMSRGRRKFLKGAGAVTLVAAGGVLFRAADNGVFSVGEGAAYAPWTSWQAGQGKGAEAFVRAAVLAASPHNTQPWLFHVGEDRIRILADLSRNLGTMDPFLREMHIGLGCAIENLALATRAAGFRPAVTLAPGRLRHPFPETGPAEVADIRLMPAAPERGELYGAIPRRRTHRGRYDTTRPLSAALESEMAEMAVAFPNLRLFLFAGRDGRAGLGRLIIEATEAIVADHRMVADSNRWFRFDWDAVQDKRDGVTLDSLGLPPLVLALAKIAPPPSAEKSHQLWLDATRSVHVGTAPLLGLIAAQDPRSQATALQTGRLWQRLHLWGTARGLAMQPLNQPLEVADREAMLGRAPTIAPALDSLTGRPSWRALFAFRAGYALRAANKSPRRALNEVMV